MINDKPSPAPWELQPCQASHGETSVIVDANGITLARIPSAVWDERITLKGEARHDKTNARLMTRAPLLIECRKMLSEALFYLRACAQEQQFDDDPDDSKVLAKEIRALLAKLEE